MLEILDAAKQKFDSDFTFNQISTWSVYGTVPLPAEETTPCNPTGFYSISKRTAEQLLQTYSELYGIKYRIFRLCNILGETDVATKTKNSIQYLIKKLKKNKDITVYNGGRFIREYMYVDDACEGIMIGAGYGNLNDIYNIGVGRGYYYGDLIEYCKEKLNSISTINYVDKPIAQGSVQARDMYLNVDKIKRLGFVPRYSVYGALDNVIAGYKFWNWS
jgi:nucleoside-diphosphate-sugar epimerase